MEFRWYCRRMNNTQAGEAYPVDAATGDLLYENGDLIPNGPTNDTVKGGCFGNGPGKGTWELDFCRF